MTEEVGTAEGGHRLPEGFEPTGPPLGVGSTAVVWPARHVLSGQEVALKVWKRPFGADGRERELFEREIRAHRRLATSPHVATWVWAEDPPGGLPWIGTELHGRSLERVLAEEALPLAERLVLGQDLLDGLAAVHALGMVHRDVKPSNVLVDGGRAALCDLGLAMQAGGLTEDNQAGTARYLAPELRDDPSAQPSARTDVYSAAMTLRRLLGPDPPGELKQLLFEAASAHPPERPADAGELADKFRRAARQFLPKPPPALPGSVPPPQPDGKTVERRARHGRGRRVALAGGAAAALLAAGAGAYVVGWGDDQTEGARPEAAGSAASAPADINADGTPVVLGSRDAGRCSGAVLPGGDQQYVVDGQVVAELRVQYDARAEEACAKLIKPEGSGLRGTPTHMALTLCADSQHCDRDWHSYGTDAGPVKVSTSTGCVSARVSMMDATGERWLVRDDVRDAGCS